MNISLSEHFGSKKILRFTFPSIIMMVFTSIYGVVDGFFVSNYAGKTPFAAINLIMPVLMIFGAIGFMIGTGGSAIVSSLLGAKKDDEANRAFSLLVYVTIGTGLLLTVIGEIFIGDIAGLLGAEDEMLEYCTTYGRIILSTLTAFMLQNVFQTFLVTAEKPRLGLFITIAAGVSNMVLDYLFVGIFGFGLIGAAVATSISQIIGGIVPLVYFFNKNSSLLRISKAKFDGGVIFKACTNGSSELMTNISLSLINTLYNIQLLKFLGEDGIAAYGVIMYTSFVFISVFIGYSIGIAPVIGYHYGARNHNELKGLLRRSLVIVLIFGAFMTVLSEALSSPLSGIFVGYDKGLFDITLYGFRIYSLSYLLSGLNIFASAFFTALGNGLVSAVISFTRTLLFQAVCVFALPAIIGEDGIWYSIIAAEGLAVILSIVFLIINRKKYDY